MALQAQLLLDVRLQDSKCNVSGPLSKFNQKRRQLLLCSEAANLLNPLVSDFVYRSFQFL